MKNLEINVIINFARGSCKKNAKKDLKKVLTEMIKVDKMSSW